MVRPTRGEQGWNQAGNSLIFLLEAKSSLVAALELLARNLPPFLVPKTQSQSPPMLEKV